jgi:hypothetical protein
MNRVASLLFLAACGGHAAPSAPAEPVQHASSSEPLVGTVTQEQVLAEDPAWRAAFDAASPDPAASDALAHVPPGAEVDVYFGTWCKDSRYEVPRLWKALAGHGTPPFTVRWIAVDRAKHAPEVPAEVQLQRVPTFVVKRSGQEVGRIVEHAPTGIERELGALLARP